VSAKDIRRALATFTPEEFNPGRGNVYLAAITLPGDHRDDLVAATAEAIATWFGRVVIYEDEDKRGRAPGEMTGLIAAAARRARPGIAVARADGPRSALSTAVAMAAGGPVLFLYEKLATARDALAAVGAQPWSAETTAQASVRFSRRLGRRRSGPMGG
jgi:cyanophycin synthetase